MRRLALAVAAVAAAWVVRDVRRALAVSYVRSVGRRLGADLDAELRRRGAR